MDSYLLTEQERDEILDTLNAATALETSGRSSTIWIARYAEDVLTLLTAHDALRDRLRLAELLPGN